MPKAKIKAKKKTMIAPGDFLHIAGQVLSGLATNPCRPTPEEAASTALAWTRALVSRLEE